MVENKKKDMYVKRGSIKELYERTVDINKYVQGQIAASPKETYCVPGHQIKIPDTRKILAEHPIQEIR